MMLIILGDGVVANVTLNKSGMKGAGSIQITLAWGLAVMVPAFIFGAASGASFNPALTIALAVDGSFDWAMVPGYIIAQFAGAFVGAIIVYLMFKDQFDATDDPGTKLGVFSTGPSVPNMSLGGLTGDALNPARDIGPRIAHAVLPIKGKGSSNWGYAPVPVVGPIIGGIVAVLLYQAIPW